MKKHFWHEFKKPIYALAPIAGVADSAFRQICKEFGADLLYSEMASVAALCYDSEKTLELVEYDEKEKPYVVQLFGKDPRQFAMAAKIITEKIKPDGIDINFGCPVKKVQKQGAGAVLMGDMKNARECIKATIENTDLPVSIKTRIKVGKVSIFDFLDYIGNLDVKAIMVHGRTLAQGFAGEIDMEAIKKVRNYFGGVILANGGIGDYIGAERALKETGADGIGIARGAYGRPWIFREIKNRKNDNLDKMEVFKIALRHARLAYALKGEAGILEMRKHLCWYVNGMPGAKEYRRRMIEIKTMEEIESIIA